MVAHLPYRPRLICMPVRKLNAKTFDWHGDPITRDTPITNAYRNTQNVRCFFKPQCGDRFKFDRCFMAWLKGGKNKSVGDAAAERLRRDALKRHG
jgi:Domain of unknown function (DUF6434)